jgi:hypothetical protein
MKRTKRALPRDIHDVAASLVGYEVIAVWDDMLFNHWAINHKEAQEWADQYLGTSARVRVWAGNQQVSV